MGEGLKKLGQRWSVARKKELGNLKSGIPGRISTMMKL
jgi:hypothetical protein